MTTNNTPQHPTQQEAQDPHFGRHASGRSDLSRDHKKLVAERIRRKHEQQLLAAVQPTDELPEKT